MYDLRLGHLRECWKDITKEQDIEKDIQHESRYGVC